MGQILIENGRVVRPDHIEQADLWISDGKITEVGEVGQIDRSQLPKDTKKIDASGLYISPGFIDLQVNGGGGYQFIDGDDEAAAKIVSFHIAHGTTGLLATLITASTERIRKAIEMVGGCQAERVPAILGVHLEGPFISEKQAGAHDPKYIRKPSVERFHRLIDGYETTGLIRMVTLAPEHPGADRLIEAICQIEAIPSLGHSNASYEQALEAVRHGIRSFTHLFNAMRGFHHREPGVVGAAFDSDVSVGLIADGVHLHPATLALVVRLKRIETIYLVTDAVAATGMKPGRYRLGEFEVVTDERSVRLEDGTLAGNLLPMDRLVKNMVELIGIGIPQVVRMVSLNPARLLGIDDRTGSIEIGKDADIVIFDDRFVVHHTLIAGEPVYIKEN
ncbi:MAG: N-acetylglucosamine-6-phosphate deacetylase [Candidatus Bipolaricaulia bacterium]